MGPELNQEVVIQLLIFLLDLSLTWGQVNPTQVPTIAV